jgi:RHS repeat-associated protein
MHSPNSNYFKTHDRYLYQGSEMDKEIKGEGNSVNYRFRMHDPRLGRFFAIDPLASKYAHYTPYSFSGNKLIAWLELEGLEEAIVSRHHKNDGTIEIKVYSELDVNYDNTKDSFWQYAMSKGNKDNWTEGYNSYRVGYSSPSDDPKFHGRTYGVLVIDSYQDNRKSEIKYINKNLGIVDGIEDAKLRTMMDGLVDMGIGAIGIFTAGVEEIGSGGFAATIAYTQFTFSLDKFTGGSNKFCDPKQYIKKNSTEAAPLKYLVGKIAGENGEMIYELFDLTSGTASAYSLYKEGIKPGKGFVEFIGVFDTSSSAKDFIKDLILKDEKKN